MVRVLKNISGLPPEWYHVVAVPLIGWRRNAFSCMMPDISMDSVIQAEPLPELSFNKKVFIKHSHASQTKHVMSELELQMEGASRFESCPYLMTTVLATSVDADGLPAPVAEASCCESGYHMSANGCVRHRNNNKMIFAGNFIVIKVGYSSTKKIDSMIFNFNKKRKW